MTILIGEYEFEGPFRNTSDLEEEAGLYAVLHQEDDEYTLIQLSQASDIKSSIEISPSSCSIEQESTIIAVCYTRDCGLRQRQKMVDDTLLEFDYREEEQPDHLAAS